jgi:hypothetical protein
VLDCAVNVFLLLFQAGKQGLPPPPYVFGVYGTVAEALFGLAGDACGSLHRWQYMAERKMNSKKGKWKL